MYLFPGTQFIPVSLVAFVWPGGVMVSVGLVTLRLQVCFSAILLSGNNLGQVVHTHLHLSPSSIL